MDQASKRALCETFLSKLESIVGGISDDMLDVEGDGTWMEGRVSSKNCLADNIGCDTDRRVSFWVQEKMRKIADIWRKDQVFSTGLIATLQDKIKTAELRAAASEVTKSLAAATTANEQQQLGKDKGASTMAAGNSGDAQGQGQLGKHHFFSWFCSEIGWGITVTERISRGGQGRIGSTFDDNLLPCCVGLAEGYKGTSGHGYVFLSIGLPESRYDTIHDVFIFDIASTYAFSFTKYRKKHLSYRSPVLCQQRSREAKSRPSSPPLAPPERLTGRSCCVNQFLNGARWAVV